jgi:hypothetical protein
MQRYATAVRNFVSLFLVPYAGKFQTDYASFRPLEEEGRDLPLHKRNDLLHVDAFPSRPTRGGRILRIFTNVNLVRDRVWVVGDRFPQLATRFAESAGLKRFAQASGALRGWKRGLGTLGLPVADRAPYDKFMLHFHDWLKENTAFQNAKQGKEQLEFPPASPGWCSPTAFLMPRSRASSQWSRHSSFRSKLWSCLRSHRFGFLRRWPEGR